MTFGILKSRAVDSNEYKKSLESNNLREIGTFYEHKTNTAGSDYVAEQLEKFVTTNNGSDPTEVEQGEIFNQADRIATWLSDKNNTMIVVKLEHDSNTHETIKKNYDKYIIFRLVNIQAKSF